MSESRAGVLVQAVPPTKGPGSAAGRTVYILIGLNLVVQILLAVAAGVGDMDPVDSVRLSLVVGLGLYAAAGAWILRRAASLGVRPRLGGDTALVGAAEGVVVGGGSALFLVAVLRVLLGHPVLDPTIAVLAAGGSVGLLVLGVVVVAVVAPVVEELIFRGFMAEAFRSRGRWDAVIVSMIAFGLAHLRPAQLRYYMFLGMALAVVYLRRGLIGSVSAHAAFNGALVLVAVAAGHGPPTTVDAAGARVSLPAAWTVRPTSSGDDLTAASPAGSRVELAHVDVPAGPPSAELLARAVTSGSVPLPPRIAVDPAHVTVVDLPAGRGVSAGARVAGHDARIVMVAKDGRLWLILVRPAADARDSGDLDGILRSWQLP
jgi:membrane protease YdiL (CAAX protease family)